LNSLLLYIVLAELKLINYIIKLLINYIINILLLTQFTSLLLIAITRNNYPKHTYKRTKRTMCTLVCNVISYSVTVTLD